MGFSFFLLNVLYADTLQSRDKDVSVADIQYYKASLHRLETRDMHLYFVAEALLIG